MLEEARGMKEREIWFAVASQALYGAEVLRTVAERGTEMAAFIDEHPDIPCRFVYKGTVKSADEASELIREANHSEECCGLATWAHTFSPSKMWINALSLLQKPWCHFATQYNRSIPAKEIDMDFMNLNQAAHGDREHGFIGSRMRVPRKIVVGYWQDDEPLRELGEWMRSAVAYQVSRDLRVMRFGDNMREVAVTEGDKVEAQIKLGWQVNTWPVGELADEISRVSVAEADDLVAEYRGQYSMAKGDIEAVRYQAKQQIAMEKMLVRERATAFTNTFEDLWGMEQLPGLATQHLMTKGYGYGAEGDWKTAAMTRVVKAMTAGLDGGTSFMEDYTYHFEPGNEHVLGAHMLEVCPSIASGEVRIEVHPLGIGGKDAPARLVFGGRSGEALAISLIDMGGRLRLIVQEVECVEPLFEMPNLPVARVMWRPKVGLAEGIRQWILAGGAHHTVLTYAATARMMTDWAEMVGVESVHLDADTRSDDLKDRLQLADVLWKLKDV